MAKYILKNDYKPEAYDTVGNAVDVILKKGDIIEGVEKTPFVNGKQLRGVSTTVNGNTVFVPIENLEVHLDGITFLGFKIPMWVIFVSFVLTITVIVYNFSKIKKVFGY